MELLLAAVIQIKAPSYNNTVLSINTILGYTFLSLLLLTTVSIPVFLLGVRNKLFNPPPTFLKIYGTLFDEFKNDQGLLSSFYYPLFFWRRAFYVFAIAMLGDYFFAQAAITLSFSLLNLAFLLHYMPYAKGRLTNIVAAITEVGIFLIFAMSASYEHDYTDDNSRIIMWTIVALIFAVMFVNFVEIFTDQVK